MLPAWELATRTRPTSQGFDTGPNPGGYSLASVGVYVTRPSLEAGEAFTVHIYTAASNGTLDTLQHTLTSPASYTENAVNTFTAPAGATLDASTDYLVVFEGTGDVAADFVLGVTASNAQDGGTRVGWAIENARRFNGTTNSSGESFQISVNGTAIPTPMPSNSGLVPTGLSTGDKFRLIFLSSTKRNATSDDIADYNTFIQNRAAAGHTDIQTYSSGFRAVGCTADTDALDNTATRGTSVVIYWLNGNKVADDYGDFYDGSWDDEANDKNEDGNNGPDTSMDGNFPWTGCNHDGTGYLEGSLPLMLGSALGVGNGRPNSSTTDHGPIYSGDFANNDNNRPMYGLSELFAVAAPVVTNSAPTFPSSTAARSVAENTAAGQDVGAVLTATDSDGDPLTYTLEGADAASFALDTTTTAGSARIRTKTGVTYNHEAQSTYTVVVKADDGNSGTATVTVTITVTDVNEVPGQPAAPSVSATSGSTTSLDVSWTAPTNTGPDIDNYDLRYREGTSGGWTNSPQNVTATVTTIGSLDAGTSYQVQVRATNAEGDSGWSLSGSGTTDAAGSTAPDPPTDLSANAKGETQIDLSWTAPADNGGEAISGYKVEVSANGTTTWSDLAADTASTDTTYSHTGLAAGTTRHYRVSAINSIDTGAASGVAGATTAAANVLVSNTGRSVDPAIAAGVGTGDQDKTHSQGFDTGPNPGGYSLASVGVYVSAEDLAATEAFTVHIYTAASNGTLDTLQHTLTSPASYTDNAVNTFTAPAGATLDASTDYFVVFEGTANAGLDFVLGVTGSNAQDGGTRVGWAIENARRFNSVTSSSGESFQISVNGTAIPTPMPSNSGLVPTGLALGAKFRLLFLSSTTRDATASGISNYNTHVKDAAAAAGHTAIQAYEAGFRAVGCTSNHDARVNTRTLHTTSRHGRADLLAQRRQGRRRLRGFLRRVLGRGGRRQERVRHRRPRYLPAGQLPLDRLRPRRH